MEQIELGLEDALFEERAVEPKAPWARAGACLERIEVLDGDGGESVANGRRPALPDVRERVGRLAVERLAGRVSPRVRFGVLVVGRPERAGRGLHEVRVPPRELVNVPALVVGKGG